MTAALRPLREAVDKGKVRAVPLGSALLDPSGHEGLVAEYGFYVDQIALTRKLQGRPVDQVATIALTRGGWHYTGVDIDRNGRLDVLMAESANQIFFIYDLESMPADETLGLGRETLVVDPAVPTGCRPEFSGAWEVRPPTTPPTGTPPAGFVTLNRHCGPGNRVELSFYPFELVRAGASLRPRLRADAPRETVEEWGAQAKPRATDFTLRVPAPISKAYELPALSEGYTWSPNSLTFEQIRWTSQTEGEILFSLSSGHRDRGDALRRHRVRIPFNLTDPQRIRLGDTIQISVASRFDKTDH